MAKSKSEQKRVEALKAEKAPKEAQSEPKSKSPIINVSRQGVAVFRQGMHPRNLRKQAQAE